MIIFYCQNIADNSPILDEDEFIHCIKVLRKKSGDIITVTNGTGHFAEAEILTVSKNNARLKIISTEQRPIPPYQIHLAVAPPKNRSRIEILLEKCVELGVDHIYPYYSQHSERVKVNLGRAQKIMRSAALQSQRVMHPQIHEPIKFEKLLDRFNDLDIHKYMASFNSDNQMLPNIKVPQKNSLILIGPEGDFSKTEIQLAKEMGYQSVNLSFNRLRTETAAIVAVDLLYQKIKV